MSHLQFPCPECQVNLRLPTSLAGKTIRCQRCKCVFKVVVPSDKPEAKKAEAPDRPKSASSPVQASRPERSGKPARTDEVAATKSRRSDDARRRSEEEHADRARKRGRSSQGNPVLLWCLLGVGAFLLLGGGISLALYLALRPTSSVAQGQDPPGNPAPLVSSPIQPAGVTNPKPKDDSRQKPPPVDENPKPKENTNPTPKDEARQPPAEDDGPPDVPRPLPQSGQRLFLTLDAGGHTAMARRVLFTPDGKFAVSVGSDKTVRIWDVDVGETVAMLHAPVGPADEGTLFAAALSPEGRQLAVGGIPVGAGKFGMPILVIDLSTGRVAKTLLGHENLIAGLAFAPKGRFLASIANDLTARVWDLQTKKQVRQFTGHKRRLTGLAYSPDGKLLATSSQDNTARLYSIVTGQFVGQMTGHTAPVNCVYFTPDGTSVVTGSVDGSIRFWDLQGKQLKVMNLKGAKNEPLQVISLSITRDGKEAVYTGVNAMGYAGVVNLVTGAKRLEFKEHSNTVNCSALSPDGKLALTHGGDRNETFLWRMADGAIVHRLTGKGQTPWAVAWRTDGKAIAWGNANRGDKTPLEQAYSLSDLEMISGKGDKFVGALHAAENYRLRRLDFFRIAVEKDGKQLFVFKTNVEGERIYSFSLVTKTTAVMGGSYGMYLIDLSTGRLRQSFRGHTGLITAVAPSPDGRYILSGSSDQTMCIFHESRPEPLLTIFAAGREWIAWTPEGYYAASAYGERLMGWLINNGPDKLASYYPAVRFRSSLYQPEAIRRLVRAGSIQRALDLAARARKKPAQESTVVADVLPPVVGIDSPGDPILKQAKFEVKATATSTGNHPVTTLRLLVDGRPWQGTKGMRVIAEPKLGEAQASWQVELPGGKHQLVVLADSAVSRGASAPLEVTSSGQGLELPNLYVLAMGVSAYPGKLRLQYAASDADLIAAAFTKKTAGVFKKVQVRQLKDRQATRAGMAQGLAWLQKVMTPRDVAVISFSGHGARDDDGNFFLVPVDVRVNDPGTLLSGDKFKEALANLPGKVVCLLDACHSGTVAEEGPIVKPGRPDDLIRDLVNDEYGVVVMCSSLGSEYSMESSETRAGFFTLSIVEGLAGKADLNGDSYIYIHELNYYAGQRVQQLSGGKQNPTTGRPPGIRTFPLAKAQ